MKVIFKIISIVLFHYIALHTHTHIFPDDFATVYAIFLNVWYEGLK